MNIQRCGKCEKELPEGSIKYVLSIRLFADFDGHIESSEEEQKVDDIEQLIDCLSKLDQEEIENEVHQEMAFLLCPDCRSNFSKNPLNIKSRESVRKVEYHGILH